MSVLVAYASKHGATEGIAERVAGTLTAAGQPAEALHVKGVRDLSGYDAFVVGSAAYMGSWLREAGDFVRKNSAVLATRPVWLFSSGPLGTEPRDNEGRDLLETSAPKEFAEFGAALDPRGCQVFFGALDPSRLTLSERLIRSLPAGRELLPQGDFRDWAAIDAWAEAVARELAAMTVATT